MESAQKKFEVELAYYQKAQAGIYARFLDELRFTFKFFPFYPKI